MTCKFLVSINNWRKSLVGQLLLRFWVCHIIFFIIIGLIQYNALKDSLYQGSEQNLVSDYHSISSNLTDWLGNSQLRPGRFAELRPGNFVAFYSADYQPKFIIYSYGQPNDIPVFTQHDLNFDLNDKALAAEPFIFGNTKQTKYMLLVKPVLATGISSIMLEGPGLIQVPILGYAVIGEPLLEEELILERNIENYIFNALLVLLLSTILSALALQKPLEPLLNISSTARKIAGGRYNLRLPYQKTASEIEQLREALNHMLCQMEIALKTERTAKDKMARFIADASHELRTPLTSIRGFLEILQRGGSADKELLDSALHTMLIETERLIRLTESLLILNRITQEEQTGKETESPLSTLRDVIPELLPLLTPLLQNRKLEFNGQDLQATESISASIPRQILPLKSDELKQILYNLLHNAIQYTGSEGIISVLTKEEPENFVITIQDNGKGIPAEDLPHVFERLFRGDRSRSHTKGQGSGLGLAIVSELVKTRGGDIKVESKIDEGTSFIISFPRTTTL